MTTTVSPVSESEMVSFIERVASSLGFHHFENVTNENRRLAEQVNYLLGENGKLETNLFNANQTISEKDRTISDLSNEVSGLQASVSQQSTAISALQNDRDYWKSRAEQAEVSLVQASNERDGYKYQVETLTAEKQRENEARLSAESKLNALREAFGNAFVAS